MLKVALTGGIASGKSLVSDLFLQLGTPIVDTDIISHQLMSSGGEGYHKAIDHFGPDLLNNDGSINRSMLRQLVFDDTSQRDWLEQMLHPLIAEESERAMQQHADAPYAILVVPLLFEAGFEKLVNKIIAIDCPRSTQLKRLIQRDGISEPLADKMIDAQLSNADRLARADFVIHNRANTPVDNQVNDIHQQLLALTEYQSD